MKKLRIGIVTHYYNSVNYGGNLQAYALCEMLKKLGVESEQLALLDWKDECYRLDLAEDNKLDIKERIARFRELNWETKFHKIYTILYKKIYFNKIKIINQNISQYHKVTFENFNQNIISHSDVLYTMETLPHSIETYDVFITGSDQVWNPRWYYAPFFLDFVPPEKMKISYAASISQEVLTREQEKVYASHLCSFDAISVREEQAIDTVKKLVNKDKCVECHLDPTLLLSKDDWDEITAPSVVEGKYIFCYFLGGSVLQRNTVRKYARKKELKIVTIPYLNGSFRLCDEHFGDIQLFDIGPDKFLSLIQHAEFVFTDSFHATVFSGIYERQYVTFQRDGAKGMGARIYTLTELYETEERFCDTDEKTTLEYIENLIPIDYIRKLEKLEQKRKESIDFLVENLN